MATNEGAPFDGRDPSRAGEHPRAVAPVGEWPSRTSGGPADALRADVRLLGELVGEVLREQQGERLYSAVERLRTGAIAARAGGTATAAEIVAREEALHEWVERQPDEDLLALIRAFGVYFHVINLAEQHHRVRMLRAYARGDRPVHESVAAAMTALAARGVPPDAARNLLSRVTVHPVFTAHPSEARRRTLLLHLERIMALLDRLDDPRATPSARQQTLDALRRRITEIYQTAETRAERPSVEDEARTVQYFVAGGLYDVAPRVREALERAFRETFPGAPPPEEIAALRIGSWVGGDRDGNPAVTPEVTRRVARLAREAVLRRYREEVQQLGRELSLSMRLVGASEELLASIQRDRADLDVKPVSRWHDQPYRQKLGLVGERLRRTEVEARGGYADAGDFAAELALIERSLRAHRGGRIADGPLRDLRERVRTFGFSLGELEVRQHAERHARAVAELLRLSGSGDDYFARNEAGRLALLEAALAGAPLAPAVSPAPALSAETRETLETFAAMADIQRALGREACQTYIISMARTPSDVLAALLLARESGLFAWYRDGSARCDLDIVPLFETIAELEACDDTLRRLAGVPAYRAALAARGNRQQIMIGYSDSNKEAGYLAATWATHRAAAALTRAAAELGLELVLFHGRGGAIGRGGGPMGRAILARAREARTPRLKATEQGEVIFARYGVPEIAERHLEQMLSALLLSAAAAEGAPPAGVTSTEPPDPWIETVERLVASARRRYDAFLRDSPAALAFFRQATPFPELATLRLASRPVSRTGDAAHLSLEDLRAIPWVFSWTQIRANLPGWYGVGSALEAEIAAGGLTTLREMYSGWRFFALALDNAQISLATADMATVRRYATLADRGGEEVLRELADEHARSVAAVLRITGQRELLENVPTLLRTIRLRNPYVDALHLVQVALLRRYRALPSGADAPEERRAYLLDAIHHSINGIAAGLQTTG